MCLIVFAWRPGHSLPLIVAANRDEFYARPSLPLARWEDHPNIYAGRDLQAGGTWLGISSSGRFAALTNIRNPQLPQSPEAYLKQLAQSAQGYAGFNLLVGDRQQLWHFNPQHGGARQLAAGLYGLSNADLDSPWPKLQQAKAALENCLAQADLDALLEFLHDGQAAEDSQLPDTGVPLEIERLLSSVFIASPSYGTRASTAVLVQQDGLQRIVERRFGPEGLLLGETRLELR